ncbi:YndJ family protein [Aquibacillus saliphilus]|uniref:YndJ family protein n=1 Tax=Aquibacillus saliphilus TaxID=1909422 RepID=UPI001CEFDC57|nr:YndJ family protein [Aquibacillus saliphilus]
MHERLIQIIHSYVPIGMVLWLFSWFIPIYVNTERIILFAAFVVVPLSLFRIMETRKSNMHHPIFLKLLIYLIPVGALTLAGSFSISPGIISGLLAIPWSVVTFIIAIWGLTLITKGSLTLADMSKTVGFIYISVAGIWLIAHQFSLPLLGFQGEIMLLTVNHFHYAGFVAPILFGFLHDYRKSFLSSTVVILGVVAPILIALGMTFSPLIEWLSVIVFVFALILYSSLVFIYVIPNATRWTKGLHIISSGIIWITMGFAIIYGLGQWTGSLTIPISKMILFHGYGNAVIFSFLGVLAWHSSLMDQQTAGIPFSRIQGTGKIGSTFFQKRNVLNQTANGHPTGLIDHLQDYKNNEFRPDQFHPDIIDFYENTQDYDLLLIPHWSKAFRLPARLYKLISHQLEQMNFPLEAETREQQVSSMILPIQDQQDGRKKVRAWVRTYNQTGKSIYAALYSTHVSRNIRYMNIAFPLPFSQMTSILYLQHAEQDSLRLTSWLTEQKEQDQGVYLVLRQKAIRLPINETITVWKELNSPAGAIEAKHDMWLFGSKFLSLDYHIYLKNEASNS